MDGALKAALRGIGCVFGLPVVVFLLWDIVAFRPHLAEIERILAQADQEDRRLTPTIHRLINANIRSVSGHVGSMLCWRLDPKPKRSIRPRNATTCIISPGVTHSRYGSRTDISTTDAGRPVELPP